MENESNTCMKSSDCIEGEIYKIMTKLYHGIAKINLNTGQAIILRSNNQDTVGNIYEWDGYLESYANRCILIADRFKAVSTFNTKSLREKFAEGKKLFSADLVSYVKATNETHITMVALKADDEADNEYAYIMIRDDSGDYLLNSIVNQYVYNTCDYFIYLDAKNNSYIMFSGQEGTPLPPAICTDYESATIDYAESFVADEDKEMVIREMKLSRILEQVEANGLHSFTCGIIEDKRGYTRKRLDYRYHDRENQMILLSRTDITDVYFEERNKRIELEKALIKAQTDSLTQLFNFQATVDKITEKLANKKSVYALYFIDIDDFKSINDTYGHSTGDIVLKNISRQLTLVQGEENIVGRIGGDEFVFFSKVSDENEAEATANKLCKAIASANADDEFKSSVTGSVGVALSPDDGVDYYALVRQADKRLYEAKKNGKNRFIF